MDKKIISLKASPEDILIFLEIIDSTPYEEMKEAIHKYLLLKSKKASRIKRNSVYAIALPSLKKLGLIEGRGSSIKLSVDGKLLIKFYKEEGGERYKRKFAELIFHIDEIKGYILNTIGSLNKDSIQLNELVKHLSENGVITSKKDDRLTRWLRYLRYCEFINIDKGNLKINFYQIMAIKKNKKAIPLDKKMNILLEEYEEEKKIQKSSYIKIPVLERRVCTRLQDYGFTSFDFKNFIKDLNKKGGKNLKIVFSRPGVREEGGIIINNTYYYYISIYK